jgi:hypothetical protein
LYGSATKEVTYTSGRKFFSLYIRKNSVSIIFPLIRIATLGGTGNADARVNLATGSVTQATGAGDFTVISASLLSRGDYWRAFLVADAGASAATSLRRQCFPSAGLTASFPALSASATGSIYAWGGCSTPYSYIPTTSSTATRSADVLTGQITTDGSLTNTYVIEFSLPIPGAAYTTGDTLFSLGNGTNDSFFSVGASNTVSANATDITYTINTTNFPTPEAIHRIAFTTDVTGTVVYLNGAKIIGPSNVGTDGLVGNISFNNGTLAAIHIRSVVRYAVILDADLLAIASTPDPAPSLLFNDPDNSAYVVML